MQSVIFQLVVLLLCSEKRGDRKELPTLLLPLQSACTFFVSSTDKESSRPMNLLCHALTAIAGGGALAFLGLLLDGVLVFSRRQCGARENFLRGRFGHSWCWMEIAAVAFHRPPTPL